jgi:diaminopimelate epimerase
MKGPPGTVVDEVFEVAGESLRVTAVSMGNPHAVTFVDAVREFPVGRIGPAMEHDSRFPNRVNAEFAEVVSRAEVIQRTWERGTGETMACGTGAAAVAVAGILTGRCGSPLRIHLSGGDLDLAWDGEGPVYQTGPATTVFTGDWMRD